MSVSKARRAFWAPGRVNLIGEFTDLCGGLVLPATLDLGIRIDAAPADRIHLTSGERDGVAECTPDGAPLGKVAHGWPRYVAAVATELTRLGRPPVGLEGEISSTLPIGTGLSSSAALEVAVAIALCAVAEFPLEPMEIALAARRAEHRAVGVPSGIMDQAASMLGRAGHALFLNTETLEHEHVPFPPEIGLVIVYSGVSRRLEHSGYGRRRQELMEAVDALPEPNVLRLTVDAVNQLGLAPTPARRLRHIVSENDRVREVVRLLREPSESHLARLGDVLREGHESLRRDFEVTTPELDLLVELAYEAGARAARMTGGGFGGSIVALADSREADAFAATVAAAYDARSGRRGQAIVCQPSGGARELV
jgi:galactokinase